MVVVTAIVMFLLGGVLAAAVISLYQNYKEKSAAAQALAVFEEEHQKRQEERLQYLDNVVPNIDRQIEACNQQTATQIERMGSTMINLADTASLINDEAEKLKQIADESKETITAQQQQLAELIKNLQAKDEEYNQAVNNLTACQQQLKEKENELNDLLPTLNHTVDQLNKKIDESFALNQRVESLENENKINNVKLQDLEKNISILIAELKQKGQELMNALDINKRLQDIIISFRQTFMVKSEPQDTTTETSENTCPATKTFL